MSLNAGARRMRLQPTLVHQSLRRRTLSVSALSRQLLPLRANTNPQTAPRGFLNTKNAPQFRLRVASTSSESQLKTSDPPKDPSTSDPSSSKLPPSPELPELPETISDPLNPPASTRPPPLHLPVRDPSIKVFTYLFRLGKAYTTFYKAGLKAVFTNRRLLRDLPDTPPPNLPSPASSTRGTTSQTTIAATAPLTSSSALSPSLDKSANPTRSSLLLRARVRHDTVRLPLFAVIVLICGEFTPLVVLLFPHLTPYTCRIPTQANVIRRNVESRRAASFRALRYTSEDTIAKVADGHICRSLYLGSTLWDKMGFDVPFAKARAAEVVQRIVQDDALLRSGGGVSALVDDEVVLACEERGIETLDKDVAELRERLAAWVAKSAPGETGDAEARVKEATEKVRGLLLGLEKLI
ncbi:hypothetical protein RRF57_000930 [Xylaria bambusicola]|uniref:Letm1 RBD domain-containing protein n=1 Tax=Xylaria bambusicola TaxID=326684 RepID=A0AAN7UFH2_9PEZI